MEKALGAKKPINHIVARSFYLTCLIMALFIAIFSQLPFDWMNLLQNAMPFILPPLWVMLLLVILLGYGVGSAFFLFCMALFGKRSTRFRYILESITEFQDNAFVYLVGAILVSVGTIGLVIFIHDPTIRYPLIGSAASLIIAFCIGFWGDPRQQKDVIKPFRSNVQMRVSRYWKQIDVRIKQGFVRRQAREYVVPRRIISHQTVLIGLGAHASEMAQQVFERLHFAPEDVAARAAMVRVVVETEPPLMALPHLKSATLDITLPRHNPLPTLRRWVHQDIKLMPKEPRIRFYIQSPHLPFRTRTKMAETRTDGHAYIWTNLETLRAHMGTFIRRFSLRNKDFPLDIIVLADLQDGISGGALPGLLVLLRQMLRDMDSDARVLVYGRFPDEFEGSPIDRIRRHAQALATIFETLVLRQRGQQDPPLSFWLDEPVVLAPPVFESFFLSHAPEQDAATVDDTITTNLIARLSGISSVEQLPTSPHRSIVQEPLFTEAIHIGIAYPSYALATLFACELTRGAVGRLWQTIQEVSVAASPAPKAAPPAEAELAKETIPLAEAALTEEAADDEIDDIFATMTFTVEAMESEELDERLRQFRTKVHNTAQEAYEQELTTISSHLHTFAGTSADLKKTNATLQKHLAQRIAGYNNLRTIYSNRRIVMQSQAAIAPGFGGTTDEETLNARAQQALIDIAIQHYDRATQINSILQSVLSNLPDILQRVIEQLLVQQQQSLAVITGRQKVTNNLQGSTSLFDDGLYIGILTQDVRPALEGLISILRQEIIPQLTLTDDWRETLIMSILTHPDDLQQALKMSIDNMLDGTVERPGTRMVAHQFLSRYTYFDMVRRLAHEAVKVNAVVRQGRFHRSVAPEANVRMPGESLMMQQILRAHISRLKQSIDGFTTRFAIQQGIHQHVRFIKLMYHCRNQSEVSSLSEAGKILLRSNLALGITHVALDVVEPVETQQLTISYELQRCGLIDLPYFTPDSQLYRRFWQQNELQEQQQQHDPEMISLYTCDVLREDVNQLRNSFQP